MKNRVRFSKDNEEPKGYLKRGSSDNPCNVEERTGKELMEHWNKLIGKPTRRY